MTTIEKMREDLKLISIRGRVAYGILCFEHVLIVSDAKTSDWELVLNRLWEFTNSLELDEWQDRAVEVIPEVVLNSLFSSDEFVTISELEFDTLSNLYRKETEDVLSILDEIYDVGSAELYGSVKGYSPYTLDRVMDILSVLQKYQIDPPAIEPLKKYDFQGGFGIRFTNRDLE